MVLVDKMTLHISWVNFIPLVVKPKVKSILANVMGVEANKNKFLL